MQFLSVKNFARYQHFKRKRPSWVKLYLALLDDHAFSKLKLTERAVYLELLLVASTCENQIPYDLAYLQQAIKTTESLTDIVPALLRAQFLTSTSTDADKGTTGDSVSLSPSVSVSLSEAVNSELSEHPVVQIVSDRLTPQKDDGFESFWSVYPRKVGKGEAHRQWCRIKPTLDIQKQIHRQVVAASQTEQWQREGGKYIPLPATWLHQHRWEDDYSQSTPIKPDGFLDRMEKLAKGERL